MENRKDVIIFGAGPAGLAAATKLVKAGKSVLVIEKEKQVGGISKTIEFKGCRFDLGGHRFFTKSQEVNDLWNETLGDDFLKRPRLSRMYYRNKFFAYPVKPFNALKGLGPVVSIKVLFSYVWSKIFPYPKEDNFEEWVSNRFGKVLYRIFFKTYTEKLWGIPCTEIQAEWVAQRIKGLSLFSAIKNALFPDRSGKIKTLIDEFRYPKFGPGMMYEKMAENVEKMGGEIRRESEVVRIKHDDSTIKSVVVRKNGEEKEYFADNFLSSMPITELAKRMEPGASDEVIQAAKGLTYRSFITISVILNSPETFPDTWIYIHSPEAKMGRIQNFRSWSPFMVPDKSKSALGLEYFCSEGDELWNMPDEKLLELGMEELEKIGLGRKSDFEDGIVFRVPKSYPVYDSAYPGNIKIVKEYLGRFKNLQPIGRYGMFKYNNMDHSILTGMWAAENILGQEQKDIWNVNADLEYHEEKKG